jgi:hypothetical protein
MKNPFKRNKPKPCRLGEVLKRMCDADFRHDIRSDKIPLALLNTVLLGIVGIDQSDKTRPIDFNAGELPKTLQNDVADRRN